MSLPCEFGTTMAGSALCPFFLGQQAGQFCVACTSCGCQFRFAVFPQFATALRLVHQIHSPPMTMFFSQNYTLPPLCADQTVAQSESTETAVSAEGICFRVVGSCPPNVLCRPTFVPGTPNVVAATLTMPSQNSKVGLPSLYQNRRHYCIIALHR